MYPAFITIFADNKNGHKIVLNAKFVNWLFVRRIDFCHMPTSKIEIMQLSTNNYRSANQSQVVQNLQHR